MLRLVPALHRLCVVILPFLFQSVAIIIAKGAAPVFQIIAYGIAQAKQVAAFPAIGPLGVARDGWVEKLLPALGTGCTAFIGRER